MPRGVIRVWLGGGNSEHTPTPRVRELESQTGLCRKILHRKLLVLEVARQSGLDLRGSGDRRCVTAQPLQVLADPQEHQDIGDAQ